MQQANLAYGNAEDIEAAFYDALSRADLDAMMAVWADDEEIFCIHPGGRRMIGHAAIRASWQAIFERGGVHIQPIRRHVSQTMLTSVHNLSEEFPHDGGAGPDAHVIATNIYLKTAHGWRMVSHHASVAPGAADVDLPASASLH